MQDKEVQQIDLCANSTDLFGIVLGDQSNTVGLEELLQVGQGCLGCNLLEASLGAELDHALAYWVRGNGTLGGEMGENISECQKSEWPKIKSAPNATTNAIKTESRNNSNIQFLVVDHGQLIETSATHDVEGLLDGIGGLDGDGCGELEVGHCSSSPLGLLLLHALHEGVINKSVVDHPVVTW